jgi:RsiW-degrading membrane proteinase PrsW (M82 family)
VPILWYILIALIPGLFWLWFFGRFDREQPEPKKLLAGLFFWGMAATIPAVALELGIDFFVGYATSVKLPVIIFSALLIVAPIEEYLKFAVARRLVWKHPAFDEKVDGIIYCVVAALGFATLENILVIISTGSSKAIILRFATATLMHALASGIVGYYLGLAKFKQEKEKSLISQGLLIAIILHGVYNIIAATETPISFFLLTLLIVVMYIMLTSGIREIKKIKIKPQ